MFIALTGMIFASLIFILRKFDNLDTKLTNKIEDQGKGLTAKIEEQGKQIEAPGREVSEIKGSINTVLALLPHPAESL